MKKNYLLLILSLVFTFSLLFAGKANAEAKLIYTTDARTNAVAEKIIQRCSDEDMTQEEKLRRIYMYLVHHMRYSWSTGSTKVHVSKKEINKTKAKAAVLGVSYSSEFRNRYKNVRTLQGTCYGMSKVFCILANHIGYEAHMCHGTHVTGGGSHRSSHYWCYVRINGEKRYFDVQYANRCYHRNRNSSEVEACYKSKKHAKYWRRHYRGE